MDLDMNPFHELYVTETARPIEFVSLFSPFLVQYALPLFQQGNVVLQGTQGSGKSMLLNLLKPEIRFAYHEAQERFPVPSKCSRFIGAGINLTRSGIIDIGQRPITNDPEQDSLLFALYFSDFMNYWIVRDLLRSIDFMGNRKAAFDSMVDMAHCDEFAKVLSQADCWFGALQGVQCFSELAARLDDRVSTYRRFHQFNIKTIPAKVAKTKTSIGEPISKTVEALRQCRVVADDVLFLIRIDQYETLIRSNEVRPGLGTRYRQAINKVLSTRDPRVSYRIGTRRYAWGKEITVFESKTPIEKERDYKLIDIDRLLRREEYRGVDVFPAFAKEVFFRRLKHSGFPLKNASEKDLLGTVMGPPLRPEQLADAYAGTSPPERALRIEERWLPVWKDFLSTLYAKDKLEAKLAEAWVRQQGTERKANRWMVSPPPDKPWNKVYWRKERVRQALMQLAGRCGQRLMWSGEESILSLSTGNILVFVSVCQHIWDAFLRAQRGRVDKDRIDPTRTPIDFRIQSLGIHSASTYWYQKIDEQPGGNDRQRFVDMVGRIFQETLYNDKPMSYPGHNGFSLKKEEVEADLLVHEFLGNAVDYGDLYSSSHTTRMKDRKQRIKWYLNPILSPFFRIPDSHVKEPMYVTTADVRGWMRESGVLVDDAINAPQPSSPQGTMPLFEASEGEE